GVLIRNIRRSFALPTAGVPKCNAAVKGESHVPGAWRRFPNSPVGAVFHTVPLDTARTCAKNAHHTSHTVAGSGTAVHENRVFPGEQPFCCSGTAPSEKL